MCIKANKSTHKYLTKQSKFRKWRKRRCQEMQSSMRIIRFIIQTDAHTHRLMHVHMFDLVNVCEVHGGLKETK